ncbi:homoserine kinase [Aciduricibacillus chroicocephali]|uniref:Homoserine kinase n=1 Tax=Aciduricibacillus chroicocephali TaxID=3054939 RepID=A0ABY9KXD8_9BACI|nr:homoserine kinase [Bacillaceae bacterium 44XB]
MKPFMIKVPASSANIGPGFDSVGIALERYLTLTVTPGEDWEFKHRSPLLPEVPNHEEHFIFKIASKIAAKHGKELSSASISVDTEIPLARGMGSSASAIIAGIELANRLAELDLTAEQKLRHAVQIEGHPDNVAPALFGGFITAVQFEQELDYLILPELDVDLIVYIPDFELKTEDARRVLPDAYPRAVATRASAISSMMIAAFMKGDYNLAGRMMERDLFHETYRARLIPRYDEIKPEARELGAYATVISGAGPTTISFAPSGKGEEIARRMQSLLPDYEIAALRIDTEGLQVSDLD